MIKRSLFAAVLLLGATGAANAADLNSINALAQSEFNTLTKNLGSALSYKDLTPAEPLGITGFDVGAEVTFTSVDKNIFNIATGGSSSFNTLPVPKLHAYKGLPFGIDVGLMYSTVPGTNIKLTGAMISYAILDGGMAMPALSIRGSMSKMSGVSQMDLSTTQLELAISKGFLMLTPYAGIGTVNVVGTPHVAGLTKETATLSKSFVGLNLNLGLLNFCLEGDKTGDQTTYGLKMGFRF